MRKSLILIVMYIAVSPWLFPQQIWLHNGMGTGQDYIEMSESQRRAYAIGFVNGMLLSPLFGSPQTKTKWIENCLERMTDKQIAEIILQYIQNHPSEWHLGLHILSFQAFAKGCPTSPANMKAR